MAAAFLAFVLVGGAAAAAAEEPAPGSGPQLPPGVYARVNGRDVTEREYAEFLLASIGKAHLDRYIDRLLIESEARRLGVAAAPEEVEKLVEERLDRTVRGIYRGSEEAFLEALARRHMSLEDRKLRERQEVYYDLLLDRIILQGRKVTEAAVRDEFERIYGRGGVEHQLRHILISTVRRTTPSGETLEARTEVEGLERARKVHEELLGGADFVQLASRYSDDPFTRQNDGRIPLYRPGTYGDEFDAAVEKLSPENPLSGVIRSKRGFHIIQLIGRQEMQLEEVRREIEELVRSRPPSPEEKQEALKTLRTAAEIVR